MTRSLSRPCPACGQEEKLFDGQALRARRHEAGLSMRHVAARAGITQQYLSELELGNRPLRGEMWEALSKVIEGRR